MDGTNGATVCENTVPVKPETVQTSSVEMTPHSAKEHNSQQAVPLIDHDANIIISEGGNYIIQKGTFLKQAKICSQKQLKLGHTVVELADLVGHPVGAQFRLEPVPGKRLMRARRVRCADDLADIIAPEESALDNRNLVCNQDSQTLTREKIEEMRDKGATGQQIVSSIVDNSSSFQGKTGFSQAKYVRKKQRKYFEFLGVHAPSVRLIADMFYMQDPIKIMNLRVDSLSQLLTAVSVRAGGRYLLLETGCHALLSAALLERLGGRGAVVHLFQGGQPQRQAVEALNLTDAQRACLTSLSLRTLTSRHPPAAAVCAGHLRAPIETAAASSDAQTTAASPDAQTAQTTAVNADRTSGTSAGSRDDVTAAPPGGVGRPVGAAEDNGQTDANNAAGQPEVEREETVIVSNKRKQSADHAKADAVKRPKTEAGGGGGSGSDATTEAGGGGSDATTEDDALRLLSSRALDGLLVCCRQHPKNVLSYLTEFIADSRPFAVFCPYKQPLLDCYFAMKAKGYIMLKVSETWLRHYQVLAERTHPEINMSGGGGYLLTGIKVARPITRPGAEV